MIQFAGGCDTATRLCGKRARAGGRPRPGSARTSGRAAAARGCGRATTARSCARSSPSSPSTAATSRARSASGPTSCRSPGGSTRMLLERFGDFLDAHVEPGLGTIPTFIVGHMSGENWDPAWRQGRDLYRDVWLVSQQAWLAGEIARRFGGHPAIVGWLVSNEMPLYGGAGTTDEIAAWARLLVQAVRCRRRDAADLARRRRLGRRDLRRRQRLLAARARAARRLRRAARLPDGGRPGAPVPHGRLRVRARRRASAGRSCSRSSASAPTSPRDEHAADYYRQVLHTSLLAGARGWLAWNNCDYDDLRDEDPYRHHPFELHFGADRPHGQPKPQLGEIARFARLVAELAAHGWEPVRGRRALVVPEHFERVLPFTSPEYRHDIRADLLQAYVAAREADLPIALVRERDGLPAPPGLVLVPSAKLLTAPGLDRLRELATAARPSTSRTSPAAPRTSAGRGSRGSTRSSASAPAPLRARRPDRGRRGTFEFVEQFGDLAAGTRLTFRGRRRAERPRLPARRAGRGDESSRSTATAGPRCSGTARRGRDRALHVPARAHGGANAGRQPREHLADLLGARHRGRRLAAGARRRSARARRPPPQRRGERAVLVNCSGDTVVVEPIVEDGVELAGPPRRSGPSTSRAFRSSGRRPRGRGLRSSPTDPRSDRRRE